MPEIQDPTGIRAAQAARREGQLPFSLEPITAVVNGTTGKRSGGGAWIGLGGTCVVPFVAAAFTCVLDVWLEKTDQTGPADFSIPLGEKITVPFSRFSWQLRVTGAPPFSRLVILSGYDVAFAEWVPAYNFAAVLPITGTVSAAIASPLAPNTGVRIGLPAAVPVPGFAAVTDADSTPIAASAGRVAGTIQNVGTNRVWINFGAAAVANQCLCLAPGTATSPGGSYDLDRIGGIDQSAIHAICDAGLASTLVWVRYTN